MRRFVVLLIVPVVAMALATPVGASTESGAFDWGDAQACAVLSATEVRCFASEAAMEAATSAPALVGTSGPTSSTTSSTSTASIYCAGRSDLWLYLYEHGNFGGRVLKFREADIWQNLTVWDFNDKTSSWRNDTYCTTYLAEHINGGGALLSLPARSSSSYIGDSWNDRASSLYINA